MGQTNGDVNALAVSNGVLYAGGTFTTATSTSGGAVSRTYLAAFSSTTGALATSFNYTINGEIETLSVSPDGTTLYLGGNFTTVNGATHNHIAAINLTNNTLKSWAPNFSAIVTSVTSTNTAVYVGGGFLKLNNANQKYFAGIDPTTANLLPGWTGSADARIYALAMTTDGTGLLVGGAFNTLSGQSEHAIGKVDPTTGAALPWDPAGTLPNTATCTATAKDFSVVGSVVYVAGEGAQFGCYDGDESINTADGTVNWINYCEGATQTVEYIQGTLYKGSHMHDCAYQPGPYDGGFTGAFDPAKRTFYHLTAQNPNDGTFEHWGPVTDSVDGPLAMATDGTQLFVGGEFTKVNKVTQGHITRFSPLTSANNAAPAKPSAPTAVASGAGKVTVTWQATTDVDTGTLTYRLYRSSTLIATKTAESWPWTQPTMRFTDTGRTTGSSVKYSVTASDGVNTTAKSTASTAVTVIGTTPNYDTTVAGLSPAVNWRLNGDATDSSGSGNDGTFVGGVSTGSADDRGGNGAVTLDGTSGYVASGNPVSVGSTFSTVAWFNTTTAIGGDITGFAPDQTGTTDAGGRVVWMDNDGQIVFGIRVPPPVFTPGAPPAPPQNVIRSPREYNDGQWHQVVTTYDGSVMTLYIDGVNIGTSTATEDPVPTTGYWRVGYVNLDAFNQVFGFNSTGETSPSSYYFNGSVDDASFYNNALTTAQVTSLWAANAANAP